MIHNESELAQDVQTLRQCSGQLDEPCCNVFSEVMEFMKAGGRIQDQLQKNGLMHADGNSLFFINTLYPQQAVKAEQSGAARPKNFEMK